MTEFEIEDVATVLYGYEHWRQQKHHAIENGADQQLSVSAYLDEYAKNRAVEILAEIQAVYAEKDRPWQEVDAEIRRLVGADE